jgi:hypothetical protein
MVKQMKESYDLTNQSGYKEATGFLRQYGWLISPLGWWLIWRTPTVVNQGKVAEQLIARAKKEGAKRLKIKVDKNAQVNAAYANINLGGSYGNAIELAIEF